jgi:hypothetical protein
MAIWPVWRSNGLREELRRLPRSGCKGQSGVRQNLGRKRAQYRRQRNEAKIGRSIIEGIAEGAGKMSANKKLTKDEQREVLQYSRSLAK